MSTEQDRILAEAIGWTPREMCSDPETPPKLCRGASCGYWYGPVGQNKGQPHKGRAHNKCPNFFIEPPPAYSEDRYAVLDWIETLVDRGLGVQIRFVPGGNVSVSILHLADKPSFHGKGGCLAIALRDAALDKVEFTPRNAPCKSEACPGPPCDFHGYDKTCRIVYRLKPALKALLDKGASE